MANIHFILQGKGGVGKTFTSFLLIQYFRAREKAVFSIDTDPVNASLCGFKALNTTPLEIMEDGTISPRKFDDLIEFLSGNTDLELGKDKAQKDGEIENPILDPDTQIIIDNGASSFVPLSDYMLTNDIIEMLKEQGHNILIHVPITGGISFQDTLQGLTSLLKAFSESCDFIIWQNPFCGGEIIDDNGKTFEEMPIYKKNSEKIRSIITIPTFEPKLTGADLTEMMRKRLIFKEAIDPSSKMPIMVRQRLKNTQKKLFDTMDIGNIL